MSRVGPSSDRKQDLEIAVGLLCEEELLKVAIEVVANIVPAVSWEVNIGIGPRVYKLDLSVLSVDIRKGICFANSCQYLS